MKSLTVLQELKKLIKKDMPWTPYLCAEAERVYRYPTVVRYAFQDGSVLSHNLNPQSWHAWSIHKELRCHGEIYQP
jgi:hypothetical protein